MRILLLLFFIAEIASAQGNILWQKLNNELPASGYSWSTPLIMDRNIFWAGQDKAFAALDEATGDILWVDSLNFPNGTYDSPVGYDGKVFLGKGSEWSDVEQIGFYALDAKNGNVIWNKPGLYVANRSSKPINQDSETIFLASGDTLFCLSINDGSEVWKKAGDYSNLLLDNNGTRLFATRSDVETIEVLQPNSGEKMWDITLPDEGNLIKGLAYTVNATDDYLILFPDWNWNLDSQYVYCLELTGRSILWKSNSIGNIGNISGPAIWGNMVFAGTQKSSSSLSQNIVAFNLLTGNIIWENSARGSGATNTPYVIAVDGKVFYEDTYTNGDYRIICANAETGTEIWSSKPDVEFEWNPITWGSPLLHDNKLIISTDGSGMFCYNAGEVDGSWMMVSANTNATNCYVPELNTGIEKTGSTIPTDYTLHQNYPNPFNPTTRISFSLANEGFVKLTVYNSLGQEVTSLVNENLSAGTYNVNFEATNLSSGVYFYSISVNGYSTSRKMILMK